MTITAGADAVERFFSIVRTPGYLADPYPWLARLREAGATHRSRHGVWLLTRYEDVASFLRDPRHHNDPLLARATAATPVRGVAASTDTAIPRPVASLDPPQHTRVRALLGAALGDRPAERLRPVVEHTVQRLLDRVDIDGPSGEIVADLAFPLPMAIIGDLLGVPEKDWPTVRDWGATLAVNGDPDFLLGPADRTAATAAEWGFARYFTKLALRRRRTPGVDLVSELGRTTVGDDRLSLEELVVNGIFLFVNGYHNTVSLIANAVVALLRAPEQFPLLGEQPELAGRAVEEALRYDSPIQSIARVTGTEHVCGDVGIPAGQPVMSLLGAAHRDPRAFPDPDHFLLRRTGPPRALAFGAGRHYCMGAGLARMEAETALAGLATRFPRMRLAGTTSWYRNFTLRGASAVPVRYS